MYFAILSGLIPTYAFGVIVIAVVLIVKNRRKPALNSGAWTRTLLLGIVLCWALAVLLITLVPFGRGSIPGMADRPVNFIPFSGFTEGGLGVGGATLKEAAANALLFAGGAPFIAVYFKRGPVLTALLAGAFATVVETLQYVMGQGRASTVDDVIWAIVGGLFGGLVGKAWMVLRGRRTNEAPVSQSTSF